VKTQAKSATEELWVSTEAAATIIGVSSSHFRASVATRIAPEDMRRTPKIKYFAPAVVKAWFARQTAPQKPPSGDDADLWSEFDSPNLERLRAAKADQAELDIAERTGKVIFVDQLRDRLNWLLGQWRNYGERLQHTFGREAALMHNEFTEELKAFDVESVAGVTNA
jgi:phage terminase Nu1 subunit (DNA packaging protein)